MKSKLQSCLAGLLLGAGIFSVASASDERLGFPDPECIFVCLTEYDACVAQNGLKKGCGKAYNMCIASCPRI